MRSESLAGTSQGSRRNAECYERWQEIYFDMGPVAAWWRLSNISTSSQLVRRMGQISRSHRSFRHRPKKVSRRDLYGCDPGIKKQTNLQKAQRQAQVPYIPVSERIRQNNNVASMSHRYKRLHEHRIFTRPSRSEVLTKLAASRFASLCRCRHLVLVSFPMHPRVTCCTSLSQSVSKKKQQRIRSFAARVLGKRQNSETKTTIIIILKLVPKSNMVELWAWIRHCVSSPFVSPSSVLGTKVGINGTQMGGRPDGDQTNGKERQCRIHDHNSCWKQFGESKKFNAVQVNLWVRIPCLLLQLFFYRWSHVYKYFNRTCSVVAFSGSFAFRQQQLPWTREGLDTTPACTHACALSRAHMTSDDSLTVWLKG